MKKMTRLHWFKFNPTVFLADAKVMFLTPSEVGAYILILCAMWEYNQNREEWAPFPADERKLRRVARMDAQQWRRAKQTLLDPDNGVLLVKPEGITNRFMEAELYDARQASRQGKKAVEEREMKRRSDASSDEQSTVTATVTTTDRTLSVPSAAPTARADGFEAWWESWRKHTAHAQGSGPGRKKQAQAQWIKQNHSQQQPTVAQATQNYLADCMAIDSKTKHAERFLRDDVPEWADRQPRSPVNNRKPSSQTDRVARYRDPTNPAGS